MGGQSDDRSAGSYRVEGTSLVTFPDRGDAATYEVTFDGGVLHLNGLKYLPCKG